MTSGDHNRVIDGEARRILKPLGLYRKGKSRVWLDDHGWWVIQVEFQPSASSKGSYLNVGLNWMLYEGNVGAFNIGSRVSVPFISAVGNESFEEDARKLAVRAREEVVRIRSSFSSLRGALDYYATLERRGIWDDYYHGVVRGLSGDAAGALEVFRAVPKHRVEYGYEKAICHRAQELSRLLSDPAAFRDTMRGIVFRTRSIGVLPDWDGQLEFV